MIRDYFPDAMSADRAIFATFTSWRSYVREPFPGEVPAFGSGPYVQVFQIAPGVRVRTATSQLPRNTQRRSRFTPVLPRDMLRDMPVTIH